MNAHSVQRTAMACLLTLAPVTVAAHWSGAGVLTGWCATAMVAAAVVGVTALAGLPRRGGGRMPPAPPAVPAITDAEIHAWLDATKEAP